MKTLGYERIRLSPAEWCKLIGMEILDPDGWDRNLEPKAFQRNFDKKLFLSQFIHRASSSTTSLPRLYIAIADLVDELLCLREHTIKPLDAQGLPINSTKGKTDATPGADERR